MSEQDPKAVVGSVELDAVRAKYRAERDKRLRADGEAQYIQAAGKFARYLDEDPFAHARIEREPLTDAVDVVIIGGGFSALMAGAYLRKRGIDNFRIIEAGGDFGGAWYWNRYPGAECDIEGYIYLPLLEETGYIPKEKYSSGAEIFEHCQRAARHFNLYDVACFQTKVNGLEWDDAARRWVVRSDRNDAIRARFVIVAVGVGSKAKLPGIPGIEEFQGKSFHSSRWNFDYTGGDPAGYWDIADPNSERLDKLGDKTVAVIGTGATAIQCVPYLARDAKHTYVFQRTPNAVAPRGGNPRTPADWGKSFAPGWQKERQRNFEDVTSGRPVDRDLVDDCWTRMLREARAFMTKPGLTSEQMALEAEFSDYEVIQRIHAQIDEIVADKEVAEALKPYYRPGCKRPGFNDEYLQAFNNPKLTLVDVSEAKGVERITKNGVIAHGKEYKVDCIVYATGFEIAITNFRRGIGFDVIGRGGKSLLDHWGDGISSLHGFATHGFPNWFYVGFSQNAFGFNQGYMLDEQVNHITYIISEAMKRGAAVAEVNLEAEKQWDAEIKRLARTNREYLESCTPGFYNNEGQLRGGIAWQSYSPGIQAFNALIAKWREDGQLDGYDLMP